MPEPVTLVVGGLALYALLKPKPAIPTSQALAQAPAAATGGLQPVAVVPSGALATPMGTLNNQADGTTLGDVMDPNLPLAVHPDSIAVPSDLVAALDNNTALAMRAYAAMDPADFQVFLDRYADRVVLRNDMVLERLTDPPGAPPMEPTPGMLIGLGSAAYKLVQGLNGVAAGKSFDVFGVAASAAGSIPGMNPDFVSALQGAAMGYRALTSMSQVLSIAAANNVGVTTLMSWSPTALSAAGAYPGLAALPLSGVLMGVGLVVDIGFTIIGDAPDMQKAVDVALDVASLACLFIPVIGVVIAIVIQIVKFIIDLFGDDLFGGGMSHEQREALEAARYGANLNPMFPQITDSLTPREMHRTLADWTSGYCGGKHVIAMGVNLILKEGDVVQVGGKPLLITGQLGTGSPVLLPPGATETTLGIGDNGANGGACYWLQGGPFAAMTNDEMALAIGKYGAVNGFIAEAQVGIREDMKDQFNTPVENLLKARCQTMKTFVDHNFTLDQMDMVAAEYRAQPHLNALAAAYGWPSWQELFSGVVNDEWLAFNFTTAEGSLSDFAHQNGYPTMYAFRAAALAEYETYFSGAEKASATLYQTALQAQQDRTAAIMLIQQQMSMSAP